MACEPIAQLYETPELTALQALALGSISKRYADHYRGFFKGMCREHERSEEPRAKTLLYAYRVALTGVHLLRTGELIGDIAITAPLYGCEGVAELARLKREGAEYIAVSPAEDAQHRSRWVELERQLGDALADSPLPAEPANVRDCDAWLVASRLA